jgi:hypothetical protein
MKGYLLLVALLLSACGANAAYVPAVVEMLTEVAKLAQQHGRALEDIPVACEHEYDPVKKQLLMLCEADLK